MRHHHVWSQRSIRSLTEEANTVFDRALPLLQAGTYWEGMDSLFRELTELRRVSDPADWELFCRSDITRHPITKIVHQDPITRRSFMKPRGYAGDAVLVDLLYTPDGPPLDCSQEGTAIWDYTIFAPEAVAVRERRDMLAVMIDQVAENSTFPRIFSVACGHLREFGLSKAAKTSLFKRTGTFLALDQDKESLAEVERCYGNLGIQAIPGSVKSILQGQLSITHLDFVYVAGLYDYLSDRVASRLTAALFDMLSPGGRLLVANFAPGGFSTGYMETFMDWHLIYRDSSALDWLGSEVPAEQVAGKRLFKNNNNHITYLELIRS
jgi:hypothetical protein